MIEIKNRHTGEIIVSGDDESVIKCLEKNREGNLSYAYLCDADLSDANLRGTYLRGANLRGANLRGANLGSANLSDVDLSGANLRGANLGGANLRGANLRGANLSDVDLRYASLYGAYLRDANLSCADLRGANLCGVTFKTKNGEEFTTNTIHQFTGLKWVVTFFNNHMQIGCECHPYTEWWTFTDKKIIEMAEKGALEFWKNNKKLLKSISETVKDSK